MSFRKAGALLIVWTMCLTASAGQTEEAPDAPLDPKSLNALDAVVGDAPIVAFGESSHFITGLHICATEMFKYLVEKHGFRVLVLESMWEAENVVMDFIASDRDSIEDPESFYLNAFNSSQVRELLLWIRAYNRAHTADPITVTGFQPEQPVTDSRRIREFFASSSLAIPPGVLAALDKHLFFNGELSSDLEAISYYGARWNNGTPAFTSSERKEISTACKALLSFIESHRPALARERGADSVDELVLHIKSLRAYVDILMGHVDRMLGLDKSDPNHKEKAAKSELALYEDGDALRAEIFLTLSRNRRQGKRSFIWMHNWHAAKRAEELEGRITGAQSFGSQMRKRFGDDYVVVGSLTACESCDYNRGNALEQKFLEVLGHESALVDLRNARERQKELPLNTPGTFYIQAGGGRFTNVVLADQFDAVYFIPESDLTLGKK